MQPPLWKALVWRDARQVAQVDAFFRGQRASGPVGVAPWRWQSLIGRSGALAFMLSCSAIGQNPDYASNAKGFLPVWTSSLFFHEPELFRVVETLPGALPFHLPVDPNGFTHHCVVHKGRRYFVGNYPCPDRLTMSAKTGLTSAAVVVEKLSKQGFDPNLAGFIDRKAEPNAAADLLVRARRMTRTTGPFPGTAPVLRQLVQRTGLKQSIAQGLWGGSLLWRRCGDPRVNVEWERVVDATNAAIADRPEALWDAPCADGGPVDRMASRWKATATLDGLALRLVGGDALGLTLKPPKKRLVPHTGRLSPEAIRVLCGIRKLQLDASRVAEDPSVAAEEIQQARFDGGIQALRRILATLAAELDAESLEDALELIYQHTAHSH